MAVGNSQVWPVRRSAAALRPHSSASAPATSLAPEGQQDGRGISLSPPQVSRPTLSVDHSDEGFYVNLGPGACRLSRFTAEADEAQRLLPFYARTFRT